MCTNEQESTVPVRPVKVKSNAPWVLGLIALLLAIPNLLCQVLCSSAVKSVDKTMSEVKEVSSGVDKVLKNDTKALGALADTIDSARKGDFGKAASSYKESLNASVDTLKATAELADKSKATNGQVSSGVDKVLKNDAKALGALADTINSARKGDFGKAASSYKESLNASVDTLKATVELADKSAKVSDDQVKSENARKAVEDKKPNGMGDFDSYILRSFMLCLGMFILSLFGKSKLSAITGIVIVAGALVLTGWSLRWLQILGCLEGVLFLFSGIFSITNLKKVK